MANYQEILTKAVVGKGKKTCEDTYTLTSNLKPSKVLGCWVINHSMHPLLKEGEVYVEGEYEVHIWYAYDDDKNTELHKEKISYSELIPFKMKKDEELTTRQELKAYCTNYPSCIELKIQEEKLFLKIKKDFIVDAIGEAVIRVQLSDLVDDPIDLDEEIENNVNVDYLNKDNK